MQRKCIVSNRFEVEIMNTYFLNRTIEEIGPEGEMLVSSKTSFT